MKTLACSLFLLISLSACGQELVIGEPCQPEGEWCCLNDEHVECVDGILRLAPKQTPVCKTHEPGYKPCT